MLIRVIDQEGRFDMVKPQVLETLLEEKRVHSFKRSRGWAVIGQACIRVNSRPDKYRGPERRLENKGNPD